MTQRGRNINSGRWLPTHGKTKTREHKSWEKMCERCYTPTSHAYSMYGGRGVTVCDRWRNSFEAFLADMGPRPDGYTLDRIDSNGNYCPENCRWADRFTQTNNRRCSRRFTAFGESKTSGEWARDPRCAVDRNSLWARLVNLGWDVERAVTTPHRRLRPRLSNRRPCAGAAAALSFRYAF